MIAEIEGRTIAEMVPTRQMFHDGRYSRSLNMTHVRRIASTWDERAVGVLYLSLRSDGRYAVLDGCHRHAAALERNIERLPARVFIDLTIEEEAELFTRFNRDRRRMTPGDIFQARLASGEGAATMIRNLVEMQGLKVETHKSRPGAIHAVVALDEIFTSGGPNGLMAVLEIIVAAFGLDDQRGVSGEVLLGVHGFWRRYHKLVDKARLVDRLKLFGSTQLLSQARLLRAANIGMAPEVATGRTIRDLYNKGLRETMRLPEWQKLEASDLARVKINAATRRTNDLRSGRLAS